VPEDLIEAITNKTETPAIVHAVSEKKHSTVLELEASFLKYFTGIEYNSEKLKTYNIFDSDHDFENCYGWTSTVTKKQLKRLKSNNIGFLMVNLTRVSDHIITSLLVKSYNFIMYCMFVVYVYNKVILI